MTGLLQFPFALLFTVGSLAAPEQYSPSLPISPPAAQRGGLGACCFLRERGPGRPIENSVRVHLYLLPFPSFLRPLPRPHPVDLGQVESTAARVVDLQACLLVQGSARFLTSRKAPFRVLAGRRSRTLLPLVGVSAAASAAAFRRT